MLKYEDLSKTNVLNLFALVRQPTNYLINLLDLLSNQIQLDYLLSRRILPEAMQGALQRIQPLMKLLTQIQRPGFGGKSRDGGSIPAPALITDKAGEEPLAF